MIWQSHRALKNAGVLGINRRNAKYVLVSNPRRLYPLVDDKLRTKRLAMMAGMAVPDLYGVIGTQHDIRQLPAIVDGQKDFVVKPAHGSGGNGVVVIGGRRGQMYRLSSGRLVEPAELDHHISNILSGLYSLGGQRDRALIEYRVRLDPAFKEISFEGVPDIRIIVYRGYPVMAMVRLPTRLSEGKANLHQGAIGVGVDLASGITLGGVQGYATVSEHPDTGHSIAGLTIPDWPTILKLAARCYDVWGLGYLGVDIVLDRELGPLILELNARPGLSIQIANRHGLRRRLKRIEERAPLEAVLADRLSFSRKQLAAG